jgi:dynein heavy chain 2
LSAADEFQYWAEQAAGRGSGKDRAVFFNMLMQPISKDYNNLDAMGFPDVLELVDVTQDVLDDIWKQTDFEKPYPEARMRHFMDVIG